MDNLIFVGSEAEGYYGGAYDCFGVFVSKEQFNKHEGIFKSAFSYRSHGELDGKHSDVEGDLLIVEIEGILDVMKLINEKQPDYDIYHFTEYAEEDEELNDELTNHLIELKDKIDNASKEFETVTFTLTKDEHAAVKEFIEDLRKPKIVLLVTGDDDYGALSFEHSNMTVEEAVNLAIENNGTYSTELEDNSVNFEVFTFDSIDSNFESFVRNNIQDYDQSKHTNFYLL